MGKRKVDSARLESAPVAQEGAEPEPSQAQLGARVGRLAGWGEQAGPLVDYPGNVHGPLPARSAVAFDAQSARTAMEQEQDVLLVFEAGDAQRPVITALLEPAPCVTLAAPAAELPNTAVIDGRRIVLEAADEIVFRCGEATIALRNGRVLIRGATVETRARVINRIRGGTVRVN